MSAEVIQLNEHRPKPRGSKPRHKRYVGSPQWHEQRRLAAEWRQAFAERLKFAREQLDITEKAAAAAFQITVRTYRKYEAGRRPFRSNHFGFWNFCKFYDVDMTWLIGGKNGTPPRFSLRAV
jgi:hypothetical protein